MMGTNRQFLWKPVSIAPLVIFRIGFGLLMFVSVLRFWWRGWIKELYVTPSFHFTYWGFEWVKPLGNPGMYVLFSVILVAALCIALGFFYRIAIILFFLSFTYVELIDVTTYLNHYYFISLVAFIMIWLPANCNYSLDSLLFPSIRKYTIPAWCINIIRFQMAVVYIFAGLAKINFDWLILAEPLRTWLPAKSYFPVIGKWMYESWVAYLFSWFGMLYDLLIVFFLLTNRTRNIAYLFVLVFHVATAIFFPAIGMFPFVMIVCSLIFFPPSFHQKILQRLPLSQQQNNETNPAYNFQPSKLIFWSIALYCFIQVLLPLRFVLYPGKLFWHEQGYRFSWRVMLMEKAGAAYFTVKDSTGKQFYEVDNKEFLTPLQEKMMSTQPDLILKYAYHLAKIYKQKGINEPKVYAEVYVTLNSVPSKLFIDSTVNLAAQKLSWKNYEWVLPWQTK